MLFGKEIGAGVWISVGALPVVFSRPNVDEEARFGSAFF